MKVIAELLTGRRSAPIVLIAVLVALGLALILLPRATVSAGQGTAGDSELVAQWQSQTPAADGETAILVWTRADGDALSGSDRAAVEASVAALRAQSVAPKSVWAQLSDDRTVILAVVPVDDSEVQRDAATVASRLTATARAGLPSGVQARLTGDVASAVAAQQTGDVTLLLWLIILAIVAVILATRSALGWLAPLVPLVPAAVVAQLLGTDAGGALGLTAVGSEVTLAVTFGVGIAFACALAIRYRKELSDSRNGREAAWLTVTAATPGLVAGTAVLVGAGLAMLLASDSPTRGLGLAIVIGVVVVGLVLFLAVPAALSLFWRSAPAIASAALGTRAASTSHGARTGPRPVLVAIGGVVVLGLLAIGTIAATFAPATAPTGSESAQARAFIDRAFPRGYGNQAIMLVPDELAGSTSVHAPTSLAMVFTQVHSVTRGPSHDGRTELVLDLQADPGSAQAVTTIRDLRQRLARTGGLTARTLVGGPDATIVDSQAAAVGDLGIVVPAALVLVLLLIILMTRTVVLPVAVLIAEILVFLAGLGVASVVLHRLDPIAVVAALVISVALCASVTALIGLGARGARFGPLVQGVAIAVAFGFLAVFGASAGTRDIGLIVAVSSLLDAVLVRAVMLPPVATKVGRAA